MMATLAFNELKAAMYWKKKPFNLLKEQILFFVLFRIRDK